MTLGSAQITVSSQSVPWALWYEVWFGTNANSASAAQYGEDVSGTSAVISGLTNDTRYYVWLKAKNNAGTSGFSPPANAVPTVFDAPPAAPAAPAVTLGSGTVTLSWQAVPGTHAYEMWYGTSSTSASAVQYGGDISSGLSAAITGLGNGTTYWIWLKAKNDRGTSGFSPAVQAKPIAAASAPTLTVGNGQISVTWTAVTGADSYDIFCGTGANRPASPAQTPGSSPATLSSLQNGTTYTVWVRGRNGTGTGAMSAAASAKPLGTMDTVTLAPGDRNFTASWTAVAGADSYAVYYSTTTTMSASPAQTVPGTSAALTRLTNGTTYYVWVKPRNNYGAGAASSMASVIPLGTPAAPTLTADDRKLTVSWATVAGANQYDVYYSTSATIPASPAQTGIAGTSATLTGLVNGTTYYVWVRGRNSSGAGAASPVAAGKPTASALYKGAEVSPATRIGAYSLEAALTYIAANAVNGDNYFIVLGENHDCAPKTLNYPGKTVGITLMADGVERTVQLASNGSLFDVWSGVTLTLESNVTLKGKTDNTASLVKINTSGAFTMNGGEISGNTVSSSSGGGAYVMNNSMGTFTKASTGGVITGYGNDTVTGNKVVINGVVQSNRGHAVYISSSPAKRARSGTAWCLKSGGTLWV